MVFEVFNVVSQSAHPALSSVAILLVTFNDKNLLSEQKDSLQAQIVTYWRLYNNDYVSTDIVMGIMKR